MITTIINYVNYYFPHYKTKFYCDNVIKSCLVYKYLYEKYFSSNLDMDQIIYRLTEVRNSFKTNSVILLNHLIFSIAFRAFWKQYTWEEDVFMSLTQIFKNVKYLVI